MTETASLPTEALASNTHPLLVEIGVEEIPSNVMSSTLNQLLTLTEKLFSEAEISFSSPEVYGTPRRLILSVGELAATQEAKMELVVGPPKRAAFDASGNPTAAATGFAKSQGLALSDIQVKSAETLGAAAKGKKGEYLVVEKVKKIESTASLLQTILPDILGELSFPRSMRWNKTGVAFVRPIRSIVAIYNEKVVPFSFAGVQSGNTAFGHHMMSPDAFQITDFATYQKELASRFVIIDPQERVRVITSQMKALAKEKQGELFFVSERGKSLLWEAAYTVEFPKAICGNFDRDFLKIPKEIVTTAMAEHQGYFPLLGRNEKLLPHFIMISNIETEDMSIIQKGNERVLSARLHDAQFYFGQDRKQRLSGRVEDLKQVMFHEKLGSVFEKVERIKALSVFIANEMNNANIDISNLERAAHLCKTDLVTGVVREFTSLQGTMGRVYAELEGEDVDVAKAIGDHYLPRHAGDDLPKNKMGKILAISDKLDTIVGCFGVDLIPTGSEDPYALRRHGLGIIQILVDARHPDFNNLSLEGLINKAIQHYEAHDKFYVPDLSEKISSFFKLRLDSYMQHSQAVRYDLREAVLTRKLDKPLVMVECAEVLNEFSKKAVFKSLITVYKRVARILPEGFDGEVDEAVLLHPSEKDLYTKYVEVQEAILHFWVTQSYSQVLEKLSTLHDPLNQFFDDVLVMDKDEKVKQNRLSLLFAVSRPFKEFGDFSKIVE